MYPADQVIIAMDFNFGHTGINVNVVKNVQDALDAAEIKAKFILAGSGGRTLTTESNFPVQTIAQVSADLGENLMLFKHLAPLTPRESKKKDAHVNTTDTLFSASPKEKNQGSVSTAEETETPNKKSDFSNK
jgi:hypothetical protein